MQKVNLSIFVFFCSYQLLCATGEKVPYALLKRFLPDNPIILEAGAQFGEDTAWMSEFWPAGQIHAFEPFPKAYSQLKLLPNTKKNIFVYNLALSDKKGIFPFYVADGASSLLKPTPNINAIYFHADLDHPLMAPTTTIDQWAQENNITHIDFMWLDMEGNEIHALSGALNILKSVKVIYSEVNLLEFWHDCAQYHTLKAWLEKHNFMEVWSDIVPNWHGNVLFINKNL